MRVHVHCTAALAQGAIGIVSLDTAYSDAFLIDVEVNKTGCHMKRAYESETENKVHSLYFWSCSVSTISDEGFYRGTRIIYCNLALLYKNIDTFSENKHLLSESKTLSCTLATTFATANHRACDYSTRTGWLSTLMANRGRSGLWALSPRSTCPHRWCSRQWANNASRMIASLGWHKKKRYFYNLYNLVFFKNCVLSVLGNTRNAFTSSSTSGPSWATRIWTSIWSRGSLTRSSDDGARRCQTCFAAPNVANIGRLMIMTRWRA